MLSRSRRILEGYEKLHPDYEINIKLQKNIHQLIDIYIQQAIIPKVEALFQETGK
jgi:hypothetical protein